MIRVALVGCGYWGQKLSRCLDELLGCHLKIVVDSNPEALEVTKRRYPLVHATLDFKRALLDSEIDAVVISTPATTHYRLAESALAAGKHVLLEKPFVQSKSEASRLLDLARLNRRCLIIDHTYIFSSAVQRLKVLLDSGMIGHVWTYDSERLNENTRTPDVNVIWDLAVHDFAILLFLFDQTPQWISAIGVSQYGEYMTKANIVLRFDNSLIAHCHVDWRAERKVRTIALGGNTHIAIYDDLKHSDKLRVYKNRETILRTTTGRKGLSIDQATLKVESIDEIEPLLVVCKHFIDSINSHVRARSGGTMGEDVVNMLEATQQSMDSSGEKVYLIPNDTT